MNSLAQKSVSDDDGFDLKTPLYLLLDHGSLIAYVALIFVLAGIVFALRVRPTYESNASSNSKCNLKNRYGGQDEIASEPPDLQVEVARNDLYTSHPRRTIPNLHS